MFSKTAEKPWHVWNMLLLLATPIKLNGRMREKGGICVWLKMGGIRRVKLRVDSNDALIHFSAFLTTKSIFLINLLVIGITQNFTEMTDTTRETSLTLNTNPICLSNLNTTFFLIEHKKWGEWKYPSWNETIPL